MPENTTTTTATTPAANCTACDTGDRTCQREYERTDLTCCARCDHPDA